MLFKLLNQELVKTKEESESQVRTSYIKIYSSSRKNVRLQLLNKIDLQDYLTKEDLALVKAINYGSTFVKIEKIVDYLFNLPEIQEAIEDYFLYTYNQKEVAESKPYGEHPIGSVIFYIYKEQVTVAYSLLHEGDKWKNKTGIYETTNKLREKLGVTGKFVEPITKAYLQD